MNSTNDLVLKYLSGSPIFLKESVCAVFPPTLRAIAEVGYDNFQTYINTILITKPAINKREKTDFAKMIEPLSDFQYLLVLTQMDVSFNKAIRDALQFFIHDNVSFILEPPSIVVGTLSDNRSIDEETFYELQHIVKQSCWLSSSDEQDITIHESDSAAVKALKQTMRKNREKLARAKGKKNKQKNEKTSIEFSDLVASVAVGNCGLNIATIWDITYYAFHDQLTRMGWREQFDINNRAAVAGAKIKKQDLNHWIKSINSKQFYLNRR